MIDPQLKAEIIRVLEDAMNTLTDPYLGEDDGERQQPAIDEISAMLHKLRTMEVDETALTLKARFEANLQELLTRKQ